MSEQSYHVATSRSLRFEMKNFLVDYRFVYRNAHVTSGDKEREGRC